MESGVLAGYPVVDIRVELVDGSYHDVDSSEMAFKVAGSMALQGGDEAREAEAARAGDGRRDRRPRTTSATSWATSTPAAAESSTSSRGNAQAIKARSRSPEMFGYATDLRSVTQGRATFTMQFERYEDVPQGIASELVTAEA